MSCNRIQEFLLTDYIDGQMKDAPRLLVDEHLRYCHACNDFLIKVKREIVYPLTHASHTAPETSLWARIKEDIEAEQRQHIKESLTPGFWKRLGATFHVPRPAFALASIVTMLFMIGSIGQLFLYTTPLKINGGDQAAYIGSLIGDTSDLDMANGKDSQTPIEKYFL